MGWKMDLIKTNYHTHTVRCGHARGEDEEYVLRAIDAGFDILGFSDHVPYRYEDGSASGMPWEIFDEYLEKIASLKEKYKQQITIFSAVECESIPRFFPFLRDIASRLDYLILGNHGDPSEADYCNALQCSEPKYVKRFLKSSVAAIESGIFSYIAHPDIIFNCYARFDENASDYSREICRAANAFGLPLEYNLLGMQRRKEYGGAGLGYPCPQFWEIAAEENVTAIVGVDAHKPEALLTEDYESAYETLRKMGIQTTRLLTSRFGRHDGILGKE